MFSMTLQVNVEGFAFLQYANYDCTNYQTWYEVGSIVNCRVDYGAHSCGRILGQNRRRLRRSGIRSDLLLPQGHSDDWAFLEESCELQDKQKAMGSPE